MNIDDMSIKLDEASAAKLVNHSVKLSAVFILEVGLMGLMKCRIEGGISRNC
jgi:hypothetical protein